MFRRMSAFWDLAYLTGSTPWDSDEPSKELVELIESGVIKPCRALDIGCGTGSNVIFLATKGFEAHGLDISKVALLKAMRRAEARGAKCYFHNLDFRDVKKVSRLGIFDLAIDVGCYHSLPHGGDRISYLDSLNEVLRRGGDYLIWCFVRGAGFSWGPPGVEEYEVERNFGSRYALIEKRKIRTPFRDLLFYHMQRVG
ncbi:hypothetical protein HRbin02_01822 [Candidatus Calditenuaceae archaeon HR02]|nr:hypothetical protein HRbin02_01822 [Candidatus Calditenuaceae archaeon HR02]